MRANEFVIEGPVDKFGDMLSKQVIGRKQIDQAKAKKQNVPKIAKSIQEILASKVVSIIKTNNNNNPAGMVDAVADLISQVLKKATKVNVDSDAFDNDMDLIKSQVTSNPTNIAGNTRITSAISNILNTSFEQQSTDTDEPGGYQAQVYDLPKEVADEDMLYAEHNGRWTLWRKTGRNRLVFINNINPEEVPAVKELINVTKTKSALLSFKQQQGNYYQTSTSVPK